MSKKKATKPILSEYVEYGITINKVQSYIVKLIFNKKAEYLGSYKDRGEARKVRNDYMRANNIKAQWYVMGASTLPSDLVKTKGKYCTVTIKEKREKSESKPKPKANPRAKEQPFWRPRDVAKVKTPSPPTWKPEQQPIVKYTGEPRKDGEYFIDGSWVVFVTKGDKQYVFIATSAENAKRISRDGAPLRLRAENAKQKRTAD